MPWLQVIAIVGPILGVFTTFFIYFAKQQNGLENKIGDLAKDFTNKLDSKIDKLDSKIDKLDSKIETRMDKLEIKIDKLDSKMETKMDNLDSKIQARIDGLRQDISVLNTRVVKVEQQTNQIFQVTRLSLSREVESIIRNMKPPPNAFKK